MQMAIIEFARNQLNIKKQLSEFDKIGVHIIGLMHEWEKSRKVKGTDRSWRNDEAWILDAILKEKSKIKDIYKSRLIKKDTDTDKKWIFLFKENLRRKINIFRFIPR